MRDLNYPQALLAITETALYTLTTEKGIKVQARLLLDARLIGMPEILAAEVVLSAIHKKVS